MKYYLGMICMNIIPSTNFHMGSYAEILMKQVISYCPLNRIVAVRGAVKGNV